MVVIVGLERALFLSFGNVVWERGFNLGVFTHAHLREREGGRRSAAVCVC